MNNDNKKTYSVWQTFILALKGGEADILHGSIDRTIIILAIPMMLEMMMESLFSVVDIFFVSKVGVNAVAVVGLTESMLTIIYSLGIGLSMGTTAMIARRIGEGKPKDAANTAVQAIYMTSAMSVVLGIICLIFAEDLLGLMGATHDVISQGSGYTKIMLGSNLIIILLFLINGIFRGAGDATLAMRSLWIGNGINIILDPLLIFGIGFFPEQGVKGAAVATVTGRCIAVCYQLYHLLKGKGVVKIQKNNLQLRFDIMKSLIKLSIGGTGQFIIASASWIFLMRIMSAFGSEVLAGYTIAIRIVIFTLLPAWGISNAASTMVGQNLGAGNPERAENAVWRTGRFNIIYMGLIMLIYLIFSNSLVRFFTDNPVVIDYGSKCLSILSLGYIFYAFGMVLIQSFNGSGDTRTPTIINFFVFWTFQIPLAYILAIHLSIGPVGVFWAIPISESMLTIVAFILFRRGNWKKIKI